MASTVSHTGDWHASRRRVPSSLIVNRSMPSMAFLTMGLSRPYPIRCSAMIE